MKEQENAKNSRKQAGSNAFPETSLPKKLSKKLESSLFQKHPCFLRKKVNGILKTWTPFSYTIWQVGHRKQSETAEEGTEVAKLLLIGNIFSDTAHTVPIGRTYATDANEGKFLVGHNVLLNWMYSVDCRKSAV